MKNFRQTLLISLLIVASALAAAYFYYLRGDWQSDDTEQVVSKLRKDALAASNAGKFAEAGKILDQALARKIDKDLLHDRAVVYLKLKEAEPALKILNKLVSESPRDQSLLLDRATALYMNKSYNAALIDYENIIAEKSKVMSPAANSAASYREGALLGRVLCQYSLAQYPLAVHQCRRILEEYPGNIKIIECLANSYLGMGDNRDAVDAYTRCLRLEQNADFYWGRSLAYIRDRRPSEGLADLKKASAMAPQNKIYKAKLDELTGSAIKTEKQQGEKKVERKK